MDISYYDTTKLFTPPSHAKHCSRKKGTWVLLYIQHHRRSENSYTTKQCYAWAIRCFRTNTGLNPLNSPEQNGRHFAEDIYERTFQNKNYCISLFWFKFQWSWFLMFFIQNSLELIPIGPIDKGSANCSAWWLGAEQVTSHYLKQWWPSPVMHDCTKPKPKPMWTDNHRNPLKKCNSTLKNLPDTLIEKCMRKFSSQDFCEISQQSMS